MPVDRFGEVVTAVVELVSGGDLDASALVAHVRSRLAAYKIPRTVLAIDTIGRGPNGKVDYPRIRRYACDRADAVVST